MSAHTILIVDDERHVTHLLRYKLDRAGFDVLVAHDGGDAYELACVKLPDLVVTDFQMRHVGGLELATKLRETPATSEIPVIMITGRGHMITEQQLSLTNICYKMAKPFSPRELLEHVREALKLVDDPFRSNGGAHAA